MFTRKLSNLNKLIGVVDIPRLRKVQNEWMCQIEYFIDENNRPPLYASKGMEKLLYNRMCKLKSKRCNYYSEEFREEIRVLGAKNKAFAKEVVSRRSSIAPTSREVEETPKSSSQEEAEDPSLEINFGNILPDRTDFSGEKGKGNPENLVPFEKMPDVDDLISSQASLKLGDMGEKVIRPRISKAVTSPVKLKANLAPPVRLTAPPMNLSTYLFLVLSVFALGFLVFKFSI